MYTDLYDIYLEWEKKETPDRILDRMRPRNGGELD